MTSSGTAFGLVWFEASRDNTLFCGFTPAVSPSALKAMRADDPGLEHPHVEQQLSLADIARQLNPLLRGWIGYYGRYAPSALDPLLRYVNQTLRGLGDAEVQAL